MAEPYVGEIKIFPYFTFGAPVGWMPCNGQMLDMNQYAALFAVIGNAYGGNGTSTFALPDLVGSAPVGMGQGPGLSNFTLGDSVGVSAVSLNQTQLPAHNHSISVKIGNHSGPNGNNIFLSNPANADLNPAGTRANNSTNYTSLAAFAPTSTAILAPTALAITGSNAPHENRQPFQTFLFCIAYEGVFPIRP